MSDRLEPAPSGRARCRACGDKIEKGALRFGEVLPTGYGEGEGAFWFHPSCAAHRRPEKFAALVRTPETPGVSELADRDQLLARADQGISHPRLSRIAGAERASSGRARCRECRELIAEGAWRIKLSSFADSGFFDPLGFVHATCAPAYFGAVDLTPWLRQASPGLGEAELEEIAASSSTAPISRSP